LIVCATSSLDIELAQRAKSRWGAEFLEIYGCSELGSVASRNPVADLKWKFFPEFYAEHSEGFVSLSAGHAGSPLELSDRFVFDDDGGFLIEGRDIEMVKVAGKRGSLADINNCLLAIDGVVDGAIYAPKACGLEGNGRLAAVVVLDGITVADVRKGLRERLDLAFVPRPIWLVDEIRRTPTGKLQNAELHRILNLVRGA
jgi:acyl-coenzyme A synthetase/AMP-(fatty) acid ligase